MLRTGALPAQRMALVGPRTVMCADRVAPAPRPAVRPLAVTTPLRPTPTLGAGMLSVCNGHQAPRRHVRAGVAATADAGSGGEEVAADQSDLIQPLKLPVYVFLWYAFNIIFTLYNKTALNAFPCPWFISTWQLAASGLFVGFLWLTGLHPAPKMPKGFLKALLPVALFHTIGHVSACVSFSKMAVSFTHIVKASEPVFSLGFSRLVGDTFPIYVWLSLLPIVAGVSLSAVKEITFNWYGFNMAMISNVGMVLRNIYSNKALKDFKKPEYKLDGINLFGLISMTSLFWCAPAALYMEGAQWASAYATVTSAMGVMPFVQLMLLGGLFYHLYNQASYMVLNQGVGAVSMSVGNTMKRIAVIVASVMFFKNPVSIQNWIGSGVAILGTFLYSLAKQKAAKAKAA